MESAREIIDYGTSRGAAFRDESLQRGRELAPIVARETVDAGAGALGQQLHGATGLSPFALFVGAVLVATIACMVKVNFVVRLN